MPNIYAAHQDDPWSACEAVNSGQQCAAHSRSVILVRVDVLVTPNAKQFSLSWDSTRNVLRVKLRSRAEKGRANAELLRELQYIFGCPVTIIYGNASRRKTLDIGADESYVREKLEREAAKAA